MRSNLKRKSIKNICSSGYRVIKVLKLLIEKPYTSDELIRILAEDEATSRSNSIDILQITINTLRKIGCNIPHPRKTQNYKYFMEYHPFWYQFSDTQINLFNEIRKRFMQEGYWESVLRINLIVDKLLSKYNNEEMNFKFNSKKPLAKIKSEVAKSILTHDFSNKEIVFLYNSQKNNVKEFSIEFSKFICRNNKLYLCGLVQNKQFISFYNVEKIKEITLIKPIKEKTQNYSYIAEFEVYNDGLDDFDIEENDTILEQRQDYLKIQTKVDNEFFFFQRLLKLGYNFKLIAPEDVKIRLKIKLLKIMERYNAS